MQVGDDSSDSEEVQRCVEIYLADFILPHPGYDLSLEDNDVGLVVVNRNIDFEHKLCACKLCIKDNEPNVDEACVVAGDGRTRENNGKSH